MPYTFDWETLPLRIVTTERHKADPAHMREERPSDPEPDATKTAYEYYKVRPERLPENCFAVYHTKKGVWLALRVGTASLVGDAELPRIEILRVEHL